MQTPPQTDRDRFDLRFAMHVSLSMAIITLDVPSTSPCPFGRPSAGTRHIAHAGAR
jgi:hypothetical protein